MNLKLRSAISLVFAIAILAASAYAAAGAVYTESNSAGANFIKVYLRSDTGQLWPAAAAAFPTGGAGTGTGLGTQGALAIDDANQFLFAVNAGSNSVSVFEISEAGLRLVSVAPSGGKNPVSLTVKRNVLYVLNDGGAVNGTDTIAGFAVGENGHLTPIVSGLHLSGTSVGPAEISFNTDGDLLMVTEKATNNIDVFTVDNNGIASGPNVVASAGQTPYGFAFGRRGQVFVSDAFGGAQNAGAMSSYAVSREGALHTISGTVADNQSAPCWVVLTADGRYAYTTNTASGTVSSYWVGFDGELNLLNSVAANAGSGSGPVDAAVSNDSRFVYVLTPGASSIQGFAIADDGSLIPAGSVGRIPTSASGLVAR
jgi:6-phosphogluconolactonase